MSKILIKKILNKEKVSKTGKPYKQCSILTIDKNGQEVWLNSFSNSTTESWRDGQTVDIEIEKTDYGYKFKEPAVRNIFEEIDKINATLAKVVDLLTYGNRTPLASNSGQIQPNTQTVGQDQRQEEPTMEQLDQMFGNPVKQLDNIINEIKPEDIKF